MSYRVFVRTWWKANSKFPGGLEPHAGHKRTIRPRVATIEDARAICEQHNRTNNPGRLSSKAEFERIG